MAQPVSEQLVRLISDEVLRQLDSVGRPNSSSVPERERETPAGPTGKEGNGLGRSHALPAASASSVGACARHHLNEATPSPSRVLNSPAVPDGIPIGVSVRHIHLSSADCETLFGAGYKLQPLKELYQPGQYACQETLTVVGPTGALPNVRILAPMRNKTQVEVSRTDAIQLGCMPPILSSVNEGPGLPCALVGPRGSLLLDEALIRVWRHVHLSVAEAASLGLKHGDEVDVKIPGAQGLVFCNTRVRTHPDFRAEMHIDTDEGNAAGICCGQRGFLVQDPGAGTGRCTLCAF